MNAGSRVARRAAGRGIRKHARSSSSAALPSEADAVVIGGGSIGASVLYHLQKRGLNAVLLERDQLTSGTTWHSAGMLWRLRPNDSDIEMHTYTREMCIQLEAETEVVSWNENGGLFIACNAERMAEYERLAEMGKYFGIESTVLSPEEILKVHPLLRVDDVYGGLHSPTDGTIDPTGIVNAYSKAARNLGARVFEKTAVASISTETYQSAGDMTRSRVTGVTTTAGHTIKAPVVINACGAWAKEVSAMVGNNIPLRAMKHAFVITEKIEGMHPGLPNVRDHDLSIYLKCQGDSLAIGGYENNPEFWDPDSNFSFGLFDLDYDTFGQNLEGHMQRCPAIEKAGIKSTVCGPESFTPDHKPLVGPVRGTQGFFLCCGFNSMGMMLGGGMGRELATWVVEGSPELDLFGVDCNRFHESTIEDDGWVLDRTHESYAKTYAVAFPHDEALAGRDMRKSPLHDALLAQGCVHQARHGFERPGWFDPVHSGEQAPLQYDYYGAYEEGAWRLGPMSSDATPKHGTHLYNTLIEGELTFGWPASHNLVAEECRATRNGVGLFDQSYFGNFYLEGPEASAAVQYLCGADMAGKAMGSVTYTPLCNVRGGTEADLTVTKLPGADGGRYYFAAGGNTMTKDLAWIERVLDTAQFDARVRDASDEITLLSIQGPHSRALLQSVLGDDESIAEEDLKFSSAKEVTIAGVPLLCLRLTFVGELGFELHMASDRALLVYDAIKEAGEQYQSSHGVPVRDCGYRAIDSLSAEKGYRHWHADLCNRDTPIEAGIGFTVLSKLKQTGPDAPDFLGRAALEAQRASGVQRKLACLVLDSPSVLLNGFETIWRDEECVGYIRSQAFGHTIGRTIAYGYVDCPEDKPKITNKWLESGTWHVGDRNVKYSAKFHAKAAFDPKNERIKGIYQ